MKEFKLKKRNHSEEKHRKKKKKHKKKKEVGSSSDGSDSDSSEMQWVEAPAPIATSSKRDDWMNEESFVSTLSKEALSGCSSREKKKRADMEQREHEQKIQSERELNPYLKKSTEIAEEAASSKSSHSQLAVVGDGGYSYLKKAYLRIQEQSQKEGRSMEEVAIERWGSLGKLESMIEEAEKRMKNNSRSRYSHDRKSREENERTQEKEKFRERFHKPSGDDFRRSPSPYRSVEFHRPKDSGRDKTKFLHFSSAERFKRTKSDSKEVVDVTEKSKSSFLEKSFESRTVSDKLPEYKLSSFDKHRKKSNYPAWKKSNYIDKSPDKASDNNLDSSPISTITATKSAEVSDSLPKSDELPVIYSEDDLNKLAARYLKADMMGDSALAHKLKIQLESARKSANTGSYVKRTSKREEVILTKVVSSGEVRPVHVNKDNHSEYSTKNKGKSKYFDDGSKYSLKQMFEREKLTTADDNLEMFMEVAAECKESTDIDYEPDDVAKRVSQKMAHSRQEEKDIGKAIQQHQRLNAALEKCEYCLDQPRMKRHLIVNIGEQVYLCLPNYQSMVEGHCLIVPKRHVQSFLCLDEDEWREIQDLKNSLRNMFKAQDKTAIFLETSMNFRYCPHAVVECIPVPLDAGDLAPMYFKKAIQESEVEWAHNQKLVDLTKKGLRNSIPKSLPYFHVEFDAEIHSGFAHVIEEEKYFPRNFGKEVLGGMIDIDYNYLYKNKKEDPLKKSKEVLEFEKLWKKSSHSS